MHEIFQTDITHLPAANERYVGSPSLLRIEDGWLAAHDTFGPGSSEFLSGVTSVYYSSDGRHWQHRSDITDCFWAGLFWHKDTLYALGTTSHHGTLVLHYSRDCGRTWQPSVCIRDGQWHTAPVPLVRYNGRLWRGVEKVVDDAAWPHAYRLAVLSIDESADLTDPNAWTVSNTLNPQNLTPQPADIRGCLEGNVVLGPEGLCLIARCVTSKLPARVMCADVLSPETVTFRVPPTRTMVGGSCKFTISYLPQYQLYGAVVNQVVDVPDGYRPGQVRNTLVFTVSTDLQRWRTVSTLRHANDMSHTGWQYADWCMVDDTLYVLSRTAKPESDRTLAHSFHDANYLTFHAFTCPATLMRNTHIDKT